MNRLTRNFLIVFLVLIISISVKGQENPFNQRIKKNHFGLGVSTAIFDGNTVFNGFTAKTIYFINANRSMNLDLHSTTMYGIYFKYQYDLTNYFSFALKLKYNQRSLDFNYYFNTNQGIISINKYNVDLNNIQIPIIAKFKCLNIDGLCLWGDLGFGADFNISKNTDIYSIRARDENGVFKTYDFKLDVNNDVTPFLYFGVTNDYNITQKSKLETTLSYTLNLRNNYQYKSTDVIGEKFSQNVLEIGIAYLF
ncbi:MAG: PorT family protein [Bacteroidales bacterium]|jgi:hypothetical protein|nr:PorT family protein [Bacteroidales bacterium]